MIDFIIKTVENYHGLPSGAITQRTRKREILQPRQAVHYFAKKYTPLSNRKVGEKTGGMHNSTIPNSRKTINNLIETDKEFRTDMVAMETIIKNEFHKQKPHAINRFNINADHSILLNPQIYLNHNDAKTVDIKTACIVSHYDWCNVPLLLLIKAKQIDGNTLYKVVANIREFSPSPYWDMPPVKTAAFNRLIDRLQAANKNLIRAEIQFKITDPSQLALVE